MVVLVWNGNIPHFTGEDSPKIKSKDCNNPEKHAGHYYLEEFEPRYCPGPYKCFGEEYPFCQEVYDISEMLTCPYIESGGKQCERLDPHPIDSGHFYGRHTIAHERAGNGYSCDAVEKILERKDAEALDKTD